jgi:hypothetical protein
VRANRATRDIPGSFQDPMILADHANADSDTFRPLRQPALRAAAEAGIMDGVIWLLLLQVASAPPGTLVAETDGVQFRSQVRASVYSYEVVNTSGAPVRQIEVPYSDGYDLHAPEGWETAAEDGIFRATTRDSWRAIGPGRTARFSLRVTSNGGVLGHVAPSAAQRGRCPRSGALCPFPKAMCSW